MLNCYAEGSGIRVNHDPKVAGTAEMAEGKAKSLCSWLTIIWIGLIF